MSHYNTVEEKRRNPKKYGDVGYVEAVQYKIHFPSVSPTSTQKMQSAEARNDPFDGNSNAKAGQEVLKTSDVVVHV